jgi:hypothetical protein
MIPKTLDALPGRRSRRWRSGSPKWTVDFTLTRVQTLLFGFYPRSQTNWRSRPPGGDLVATVALDVPESGVLLRGIWTEPSRSDRQRGLYDDGGREPGDSVAETAVTVRRRATRRSNGHAQEDRADGQTRHSVASLQALTTLEGDHEATSI